MFNLINIGDLAGRWDCQVLCSAGGDVMLEATK